MNDSLRTFEEDATGSVDLEEHVTMIEQSLESLTDGQVFRLWNLLRGASEEKVDYGPNFNLTLEVERQLQAVAAMRASVMTSTGTVRPGVASRDLKDTISASNTLLTTLLKVHKDVLSLDRQRSIELALTDTIQTLPDKKREEFLEKLEENLAAIA